jgi:hypothetical protein
MLLSQEPNTLPPAETAVGERQVVGEEPATALISSSCRTAHLSDQQVELASFTPPAFLLTRHLWVRQALLAEACMKS